MKLKLKKIKLDEEKHIWGELKAEMGLFPRYCINQPYAKRILNIS